MARARRARPTSTEPSTFDAALEAQLGRHPHRYYVLLDKYSSLVRKYREEGNERLAVYKLALWALRNRTSGLFDTFDRAIDAMVEHRDARARD